MTILQTLEGPIDDAIVNSLIEATPEWWKAAVLEIEWRPGENGHTGYAHKITSPEGHRDIVAATDRMCDLTFQLGELFRKHASHWSRVVYKIDLLPAGTWHYVVEFSYPPKEN